MSKPSCEEQPREARGPWQPPGCEEWTPRRPPRKSRTRRRRRLAMETTNQAQCFHRQRVRSDRSAVGRGRPIRRARRALVGSVARSAQCRIGGCLGRLAVGWRWGVPDFHFRKAATTFVQATRGQESHRAFCAENVSAGLSKPLPRAQKLPPARERGLSPRPREGGASLSRRGFRGSAASCSKQQCT